MEKNVYVACLLMSNVLKKTSYDMSMKGEIIFQYVLGFRTFGDI